MKKVITIIGLFGLIFVQAQKVGINQDAPKATLDIKANTANTTEDVEGLLVPRVSKNKAFLMAGNTTTPLKESTLVYVDNTADYTTTPVATSVADITEKGYYFWNGTKWVKTAGENGAEWVYDPATKQINLKRSGTAPFKNEVYFDEDGTYVNTDYKTFESFNLNTNTLTSKPITPRVFMVGRKASNIKDIPIESNLDKAVGEFKLDLDASDIITIGKNNNRRGLRMILKKEVNNSNSYHRLVGGTSSAFINGSGSDKYVDAFTVSTSYYTGSANVTGYANALNSGLWYNSTGTANRLAGAIVSSSQGYNAGDISFLEGISISLRTYGSSNISKAYGIRLIATGTGAATVTDYSAFHFNGLPNTFNTKYTNAYGLFLGDIEKGTNNYAIYTNAGKVRLGDDVNVVGEVKAQKAVFTNLPTYLNDGEADTDVNLPSGSLYKLTGSGRQVFVKP